MKRVFSILVTLGKALAINIAYIDIFIENIVNEFIKSCEKKERT